MKSDLERYILDHISPEDNLLRELDRRTHLQLVQPRMISGHLQGRLLEILAAMLAPRTVLELGTFTGYSAISIARGLGEGAVLHTVEQNDELQGIASEFFEQARPSLQADIVQHIGPALEVVPRLGLVFDLVFIDADKREYPDYYRMLMDGGLVRSGSVILADNVLWSGKVAEPLVRNDNYTAALLEFNDMVRDDSRVEKVILPLRDGLTIIRVK